MELADVHDAYRRSKRRLLLLDYDGTLTPIVARPEDARPSKYLIALLTQLASDPQNTVVIISGRKHEELDAWLGELPVGFVAEHGTWQKTAGAATWTAADMPREWMPEVESLMERYVARLPGSFVEKKHAALVFHYRAVTSEAVEQATTELSEAVQQAAPNVRVMHGKKVVEAIAAGVDKGTSARQLRDAHEYDFVLAIGDDTTDEAMFTALSDAYTIHVGEGETTAQYRCADQAGAIRFLEILANPTPRNIF